MRNGWTLIELLIVLLVLTVVLLRAVPAFRHVSTRSHLAVASNALAEAMRSARLSAISKGAPVTFCAGTRVSGCGDDWAEGHWQTFIDYDHDGIVDADETILNSAHISGVGNGLSVDANGPFRKGVVFMPTGVAERTSGAFAAGRLRVCTPTSIAPNDTDIVLSAGGRIRLQHNDFNGQCPEL